MSAGSELGCAVFWVQRIERRRKSPCSVLINPFKSVKRTNLSIQYNESNVELLYMRANWVLAAWERVKGREGE